MKKEKYYMFYYHNELCAFTTSKEVAKEFDMQRPTYVMRKEELSETAGIEFTRMYQGDWITKNVLDDNTGNYIVFYTTYTENYLLEKKLEELHEEIIELETRIKGSNLTKKSKDILLKSLIHFNTDNGYMFNTLRVFLNYVMKW